MAALVLLAAGFFVVKGTMPSLFGAKVSEEESGSADTSFPAVIRIKGGLLEVASVTGERSFAKAIDPQFAAFALEYCREKASVTVPYKITYRVRVGERWIVSIYRGRLIAKVPELEPSLPVAINTAKLRRGAMEKCLFVPEMGAMDRALKSISPELAKLANNDRTKDFARPEARKTVAEFLRVWALEQKAYPGLAPDAPITVMFPGE
ncbi:hypothetical protein [Novosphingobium sp.]|uniref:hypothetical protein n=1 Tax=Novosphingobium sp. TaxID=1874826 RepID=UPI0026086213|nr:hypothetical protein [Novosphingobium sp.]